jgi:RNA polymerase sigma factor for flagellar operon FliA
MVTTVAAPVLDIDDVWKHYKIDPTNKEYRNLLVEHYLPLVKYNGERIWARLPEGVELDDLISAGVFGLMDAIDAFDMTRGVKFETYCVPRIRGAMLDELRTMDWVPRPCAARPASSTKLSRRSRPGSAARPASKSSPSTCRFRWRSWRKWCSTPARST